MPDHVGERPIVPKAGQPVSPGAFPAVVDDLDDEMEQLRHRQICIKLFAARRAAIRREATSRSAVEHFELCESALRPPR